MSGAVKADVAVGMKDIDRNSHLALDKSHSPSVSSSVKWKEYKIYRFLLELYEMTLAKKCKGWIESYSRYHRFMRSCYV